MGEVEVVGGCGEEDCKGDEIDTEEGEEEGVDVMMPCVKVCVASWNPGCSLLLFSHVILCSLLATI